MNKHDKLLLYLLPIFPLIDTVNGFLGSIMSTNTINVGQIAKVAILVILFFTLNRSSWKILLATTAPLLILFPFTIFMNPLSMSSLLLNVAFILKLFYVFIIAASFAQITESTHNKKTLFIILAFTYSLYLLNITVGVLGVGTSQYSSFGFKGFIISGNELSAAVFAYLALLLFLLGESQEVKKKVKLIIGLSVASITFFVSLLLATKTLLLGIILCTAFFINSMMDFDLPKVLLFARKNLIFILLTVMLASTFVIRTPNMVKVIARTVSIGERDGVMSAVFANRNRFVSKYLTTWKNHDIPSKVFGIGAQSSASYKMMEIDVLDLFFLFGVAGLVYFGAWIARIVAGMRLQPRTPITRYFVFVDVVLVLISVFAGHVVYSTIVAVPVGILWALYFGEARRSFEQSPNPLLVWVGSGHRGGIQTYISTISKQLQMQGIAIKTINSHNNYFFFRPIARVFSVFIRAKVFEHRRVIIHYHMATKGSFARKFILAVLFWPFADTQILHLHGGGTPDFMNAMLRFPFAKSVLRFFFDRFDKVIAVSEPLRKEIFEVFDKRNLKLATRSNWFILHNAIDVPKVLVKPKLYSAGSELKILFVGRFENEKNLPTIVSIARQLKDRGVNAHITLIGDGRQSGQIKEQIKAVGLEDYLVLGGWVNYNEIDRVYQEHHLFLIPSLHESFGIVVLEAYKNGLAALASTAGGLKEIVVNEVTGYTLDAHDVDGFVAKIEYLVAHPEVLTKLQHNAQGFVRRFDYETHIKELRKIVEV